MAQGLTRDEGWPGTETFQLDPPNKDGCRPQAREDRLRESGTGAHRASGTCRVPGVYTGTICIQAGWQDEASAAAAKVNYLYSPGELRETCFACLTM